MEISASTRTAAPVVKPAEATHRLASLRALQKAIEEAQVKLEPEAQTDDGKGRHLDLRC